MKLTTFTLLSFFLLACSYEEAGRGGKNADTPQPSADSPCHMPFSDMDIDLYPELDNYEGYKFKITGDTLMLQASYGIMYFFSFNFKHYFRLSEDKECLSHIKSHLISSVVGDVSYYDDEGNLTTEYDSAVTEDNVFSTQPDGVTFFEYVPGSSLTGIITLDLGNQNSYTYFPYNYPEFRYFDIDFTDENQMLP